MSCLHYRGNELYIENVSLKSIAEEYGTPCYSIPAIPLKQTDILSIMHLILCVTVFVTR